MMKLVCVGILLLVQQCIQACDLMQNCPAECVCAKWKADLVIHCKKGGLTDDLLNLLLMRLPLQVTVLHIDGTGEFNRNNFSFTRDFIRFPNLRELRLRHGYMRSLGKGIFEKMTKLRILDVTDNKITFLSHETFLNANNLEELILDHNKLQSGLPTSAFQLLKKLRNLSLAYNNLESTAPNVFYGLSSLNSLTLDGNPLATLTDGYFNYMPNLKYLSLKNCNLGAKSANLFPDNSILTSLSLASNRLETVPDELLTYLHRLEHLDLSGNYIRNISTSALNRYSGLLSLNLSTNLLGSYPQSIASDAFSQLKLRTLDLSHNCFKNFHAGILGPSVQLSLQTLYLSGNPLYRIHEDQTMRLVSLRHLHMAATNLEDLPTTYPRTYERLETLDVSNNPLNSISASNLDKLTTLKLLDLSNCMLYSFGEDMIPVLKNISTVRLHGNPWVCQCNVVSLRSTVLSHAETDAPKCAALEVNYYTSAVTCEKPRSLKGRAVASLGLDDIPQCSGIFGAVEMTPETEIGILAAAICSALLILILAGAVACSYFWPKTGGFRSKSVSKQTVTNANSEHSELVAKAIVDPEKRLPPERLF